MVEILSQPSYSYGTSERPEEWLDEMPRLWEQSSYRGQFSVVFFVSHRDLHHTVSLEVSGYEDEGFLEWYKSRYGICAWSNPPKKGPGTDFANFYHRVRHPTGYLVISQSYRPSSPVQLPNGRWACSDHSLPVCPICVVDYTYLDELSDDSTEEPSPFAPPVASNIGLTRVTGEDRVQMAAPGAILSPWAHMDSSLRRGTGRVTAEKFVPPEVVALSNSGDLATPLDIFPPGICHKANPSVRRFIHRHDPTQFLIYTDGACLDNGGPSPQAGCAFYFRPAAENTPNVRRIKRQRPGVVELPPPSQGCTSFHLEKEGPFGDPSLQTSNRAELRAVIAALRFRAWQGEGFRTVVIATDSEYVVEGATNWVKGWLRNNWRTRSGPVKNKDLWEALLGEIEHQSAKMAAQDKPAPEHWDEISGVLV